MACRPEALLHAPGRAEQDVAARAHRAAHQHGLIGDPLMFGAVDVLGKFMIAFSDQQRAGGHLWPAGVVTATDQIAARPGTDGVGYITRVGGRTE